MSDGDIRVGNDACPKCFASHPSNFDCTTHFAPLTSNQQSAVEMREALEILLFRATQHEGFAAPEANYRAIEAATSALAKSRLNTDDAVDEEVVADMLALVRDVRELVRAENVHARGGVMSSRDAADFAHMRLLDWTAGRLDKLRATLSAMRKKSSQQGKREGGGW